MPLTDELAIQFRINGYFCLMPSYDPKTRTFKKTIKNTISVVVALILHAVCFWGKLKYDLMDYEHLHLYILNTMSIVFYGVVSNLGLNTWNLQSFRLIFKNLDMADQNFALQALVVGRITNINWKYLVFQTLALTLFFQDFFTWAAGATNLSLFLFYLLSDNMNTYFIANMAFLQCCILKGVQFRFKAFNRLVGCVKTSPDVVTVTSLIYTHRNLCDAVENYNAAFGWPMLLAVTHYTICVLIWILKLITGGYKISGVQTFVIMAYWVLFYILQGIAVATMCERVANEGKRTITVAYKALQRHAKVPALREKFFILAQQATARSPEFTAAGFFSVNFSMLFTFVNLITTYVIVIIQFSSPTQN